GGSELGAVFLVPEPQHIAEPFEHVLECVRVGYLKLDLFAAFVPLAAGRALVGDSRLAACLARTRASQSENLVGLLEVAARTVEELVGFEGARFDNLVSQTLDVCARIGGRACPLELDFGFHHVQSDDTMRLCARSSAG